MTPAQCIDLGADMWITLAGTFNLAMEVDGITEVADKALVFAGFISAMSGSMLGVVGPEVAQKVLDQAKENCAKCMRDQLRVVKK